MRWEETKITGDNEHCALWKQHPAFRARNWAHISRVELVRFGSVGKKWFGVNLFFQASDVISRMCVCSFLGTFKCERVHTVSERLIPLKLIYWINSSDCGNESHHSLWITSDFCFYSLCLFRLCHWNCGRKKNQSQSMEPMKIVQNYVLKEHFRHLLLAEHHKTFPYRKEKYQL